MLETVAEYSRHKDYPYTLAYYLSGETDLISPLMSQLNLGTRFGVDMFRAIRGARIAIDGRGDIRLLNSAAPGGRDLAARETINMRLFEVTATGTFLLTEYFDNLKKFFEPGTEIEYFQSDRELIDKIRYYLQHPEERERIAELGRRRCMRDHSMTRRSQALDQIIRSHLADREAAEAGMIPVATIHPNVRPDQSRQASVSDLVLQALELLKGNRNDEAFRAVTQAKALHEPCRFLDYLRGACYLRLGRLEECREALLEELRAFPDSVEAKTLLADLNSTCR